MIKKLCCIVLVLVFTMCTFPRFEINATQSKCDNFNKSYTLGSREANNMVAIAQAQLGKTKAQLGYTEAWCADFVSDCAKLAGITNKIPFNGSCYYLYNAILNAGGTVVTNPQKGDLVFYYCQSCSSVPWVHVGLMINSTQSIEGNYGGKVSSVNGAYRDSYNHTVASGIVVRKYVRPAYSQSPTRHDPIGDINSVTGGEGVVNVVGWALDEDALSQSVSVHVYIGGPAGTAGAEQHIITADKLRTDVGAAYSGAGNYHGFDAAIRTYKSGNQSVYLYLIDDAQVNNPCLGSRTVTIAPTDNEKPVISNVKVSNISPFGYTVTATVSDNVGIDRVQFPTWSDLNGQDDLMSEWSTSVNARGMLDGNKVTYYVKTSEHNGETSRYCTHIYAYDKRGNFCSVVAGDIVLPTLLNGAQNLGNDFYAEIEHVDSGQILTTAKKDLLESTDENAKVYMDTDINDIKQLWHFVKASDGKSYHIYSYPTDYALDVFAGSNESLNKIWVYAANKNNSQSWYITKNGTGYSLIPKCGTNLALDVWENSHKSGAQILTHEVTYMDKATIMNINKVEDLSTYKAKVESIKTYEDREYIGEKDRFKSGASVTIGTTVKNVINGKISLYYGDILKEEVDLKSTSYEQGYTATDLEDGEWTIIVSATNSLIENEFVTEQKKFYVGPEKYAIIYDNNGGNLVAPETQKKVQDECIIIEKYAGKKNNKITLNANGGYFDDRVNTSTADTEREFVSWNTAKDGSGSTYKAGIQYSENDALALYAQYSTQCKVKSTMSVPVRDGYKFIKWTTDSNGSGNTVKEGDYIDCNITTIYAQWEKIQSIPTPDIPVSSDLPVQTKNPTSSSTPVVSNTPEISSKPIVSTVPPEIENNTPPLQIPDKENNMQIIMSTKTAKPSMTVPVVVSLQNNPGITSITLDIKYDKDVLELETVENAGLLNGAVFSTSNNIDENPYRLIWNIGTHNSQSNGKLVTLNFRVKENAAEGEYPIVISAVEEDIFNTLLENVDFICSNGIITVSNDFQPGDVNCDGVVNTKDATLINQYYAGWDVEINYETADVTADGVVNTKDATLILQKYAGWDVELKEAKNEKISK